MKTPEQQAEAVRLAREWSSKHAHDEVEGTLAFYSFMEGHDVGYQSAKELYASKLEEANATIDGLADECEGLKSILYDHDETNLPTSAKWISVKDRLPEELIRVLTYGCDDFSFSFIKDGSWTWIDDEGHIFLERDITHWMPLPAPPKEEK